MGGGARGVAGSGEESQERAVSSVRWWLEGGQGESSTSETGYLKPSRASARAGKQATFGANRQPAITSQLARICHRSTPDLEPIGRRPTEFDSRPGILQHRASQFQPLRAPVGESRLSPCPPACVCLSAHREVDDPTRERPKHPRSCRS